MKVKSVREIHVVAKYFYPVMTGREINILNTYSYLQNNGWEVKVHTTKDTHTRANVLSAEEKIKGMQVIRSNSKLYFLDLINAERMYADGGIIVLHDFDITCQLLIYVKTFLLKLLRIKKYKLIFSSHGLFTINSKIYPGVRMKLRLFLQNTLGVFFINHCVDGIRAVSNFEKRGLVKAGIKASHICVITNGLEKEAFFDLNKRVNNRFKSRVKKLGDYIFQAGRIDRVKNYEVAINALSKLKRDVNYVIIGSESDTAYKAELLALIKRLNLEDRVIFWGVVTGANKYYLMKNALATVHMSHAEGYCNSVHEALSQGSICVVSKNTSLEELVEDKVNGFLVSENDSDELARKIKYILDNNKSSNLKKMKKRNGNSFLDNPWSKVAKRVERLYLDIGNRAIQENVRMKVSGEEIYEIS